MAKASPFPECHDVPSGEWHQYRRDRTLTGRAGLPGRIVRPALRWSFELGGSENECFPVSSAGGRTDLLFCYGGCVVRTDGMGRRVWKSPAYGINAIGAVIDLDGDGQLEIVCCTGYEVIVLDAGTAALLMRHYVGFPMSAGTQASMLLCHRFDTTVPGMHLIVPLMSAKEVLVFDFRNGRRAGILAHTLWMDDAFHPTVAAADMNHDGVDELVVSKLSGLYVFDVIHGTMVHAVQWTSAGERHRNYGLLQLVDIDGDGARDVVIVAERVARHISVVRNDGAGNLSLLWDRFIEFIYPDDTTELRHTVNAVSDVDGDGAPELVVSVYNARADGRWWLEVIDPCTGKIKWECPDRYLWGVQDVDGDGMPELLVGRESDRNPQPFSTIEVIRLAGLKPETVWSAANARFAGRSVRPHGGKSNFRPMQFGHDETWTEHTGSGTTLFVFIRGEDRMRSLAEITWRDRCISIAATPLGSEGDFILSCLADVDGDGRAECVVSENNGRILVIRAGRGVLAAWMSGIRQQLEGFSAARPGPVPVVYRNRPDQPPCICIPDNTNTIHQLQADPAGIMPRELWRARGRGWMGYDCCFHSVYIHDVDGDGECEITVVDPANGLCSDLIAVTSAGQVKQRWQFPDVPPPAATRIGLYEWVVVNSGAGRNIIASSYASPSMNSERTTCVDMQARQRWHIDEYGEGEWGRGIGPWSACAIARSSGGSPHVLFLAKDLLCRLDALSGRWIREPWILWRATNTVMHQPDWDFTKDHQADFGSEKDPFTAYGSPILIDLDNDGVEELLIAGCFGGLGVLREDYSIVWWMRTPFTDTMLRLPGIADLNGDGRLCLGFGRANGVFTCLDGATGAELWTLALQSTTTDTVSCDIDGDGREEFITGTTDGRILALGAGADGKGEIRWSVNLGFAVGNPVVADVDGDGTVEVLAMCGDGNLVCIGKDS